MAKKKAKKTEADAEVQPQDAEKQPLSSLDPHIPQQPADSSDTASQEQPNTVRETAEQGVLEPTFAEQSKTICVRNNLRNPQAVLLSILQPGEEVEYREQDLWQRELDRINHAIATGVLVQVN